jgi:uncharacterized protein (DUF2235 family)
LKRIAIFCDGTWNRSDATHPTNVVRLARAVRRTAANSVTQQVIYVAGVGSGRGTTVLTRSLDRITGGAFGLGLSQNIEEVYWHLAFNYEPGDEIYIFGFSRGAFTARSLAGLLRSAGIPSQDNLWRIPEAMKEYQKRGEAGHPDTERGIAFRKSFSPGIATSDEDLAARGGQCHLLKIAYLGVWDTVGSLGVPNQLFLSKFVNWRYQFHDHQLSSSVLAARHAVSVDERRRNFMPTLWENLDQLNTDKVTRPYRQSWFPGDHGAVGGGGNLRDMPDATLRWVAEGALRAGLEMRADEFGEMTSQANALGALRSSDADPSFLTRIMGWWSSDRDPPERAGDVSPEALERLAKRPEYRPKSLEPYWPD